MTQETSAVQRLVTRRESEIEQIIAENQMVANVSALREELLKRVPQPVLWQMHNRRQHLRPFAGFFQRVLDSGEACPLMRELVRKMAQGSVARQCGWSTPDIRRAPPTIDQRFNDLDDLVVPIFQVIFQDEGLLGPWMRELDDHVDRSSRSTVEAMDQADARGQAPLRKEVVLVGGGPMTSIIASILGAFFHVTVITDQRGLGKPWRRRPIFLNSSCDVRDFNGAGLPLLSGATTRVTGSQQWNSLDADLLLGLDTKEVTCDSGRIARYPAGPRLGDLVATNILFHADDFLVGQTVDVSATRRNADGSIGLVLVDENGTRRQLDAAAVFLDTGPGRERSRLDDAAAPRLYQDVGTQLEACLAQARRLIAPYQEALREVEQEDVLTAHEQGSARRLRRKIAQIARSTVCLPRLLTLTMIEKVYEFWTEELDADPHAYLLADLVNERGTIAYIGNGDTTRTLKELVEEQGPVCAYPAGWQRGQGRRHRSTIYNETAASPQEYALRNRRRYAGVFTETTRAIPFKASRYRLVQGGIEVTYRDAVGKRRRNRFAYAFDATGLERVPIEAHLPAGFHMRTVEDLEGIGVARGDEEGTVFIVGSATGTASFELPADIQEIIQTLGIGENPVSLWANAPLGERLALTYAATWPHTKTMPDRL